MPPKSKWFYIVVNPAGNSATIDSECVKLSHHVVILLLQFPVFLVFTHRFSTHTYRYLVVA